VGEGVKTLILIRGHQGSGKSTLAKRLKTPHNVHYEADMFWYLGNNGEYVFDMKRLGEAHKWCQDTVRTAMKLNRTEIIVSNTSITRKECGVYTDMAAEFGYDIMEIICRGDFENVHGVPADVVAKKKAAIEL
jgi:predicted kinase